MCNLYQLKNSAAEVASLFNASPQSLSSNTAEQVYPGYPSLVVASGAVQAMNWGFPLHRKGKQGQPLKAKPVNNTRTDKLDSFFWRDSFLDRRCLIPVSSFAEAEGARGNMTRTWMSVARQSLFAVAGIWRETDEWANSFSMIMTEASQQVSQVHSRMPVILAREDWAVWTGENISAALSLCTPFAGEIDINRTADPWFVARGG